MFSRKIFCFLATETVGFVNCAINLFFFAHSGFLQRATSINFIIQNTPNKSTTEPNMIQQRERI
jgi:hypothetical protein